MQSRRWSAFETLSNTLIGFLLSLATQVIVMPMFGVHLPVNSNVQIVFVFTVVSLVRGYGMRRLFNWLQRWLDR